MSKENNSEKKIFLPDLLQLLWNLKWWIVLATFASVFITFVATRFIEPKYKQETWIMLNNTENNKTEIEILSDLSGISELNSLENEVFILKSPTMMRKVVEKLDLNYRYYHFTSPFFGDANLPFLNAKQVDYLPLFNTKCIEYYEDTPFTISVIQDELVPEKMQVNSLSIKFKHLDSDKFLITEVTCNGRKIGFKEEGYSYGKRITAGRISFVIEPKILQDMKKGAEYMCSWAKPSMTAGYFCPRLFVERPGSKGDVVIVSYQDPCLNRAKNVLNTLVTLVNSEAKEYATIAQKKTIEFIDNRLESLSKELNDAEDDYKTYQSSNIVLDLNSQSLMAIDTERKLLNNLNEVKVQLEVVHMVKQYILDEQTGKYSVVPANIGVNDSELVFILQEYNNLAVERNRIIANSSEKNPKVFSLNTQLEEHKKAIVSTVANLERVYTIRKRELTNLLTANKIEMETIPQQQFQIQQLARKIDVLKPLFLLLQQKREETQISMYSQGDKFFIIEPAFGSQTPVSPRAKKALIIAFLIGLCIAPGFAFFRSQLRTKIETKEDVTSRIDSPVIAVLPKSDKIKGGLLPTRGRDSCSEAFSLLRTNLQYIPDAKVIQITSSIPDEGKTFTAVNLALSLAYVGKKTALLGFDLRKPSLSKIFKKKDIETNRTIVGYLLGRTDNPQDIVLPSDTDSNLDIAICGPVPHNPLNLMAKGNMEKLIGYFRENYDYVIVDSAPYFPVADASVLNKYVDATLFVIRANYSELRLIEDINNALESQTRPIKNVNLVINGFDAKKARYSYGYSKKYSYVYGYGSGYGDEPQKGNETEKKQ